MRHIAYLRAAGAEKALVLALLGEMVSGSEESNGGGGEIINRNIESRRNGGGGVCQSQ